MSATLRVTDFTLNKTLFSTPPPVIKISARQHPVTTHFNRRTSADYVTEAASKAMKIHTRLPSGGILIFLTGQDEIVTVCKRLEARFGKKAIQERQKDTDRMPKPGRRMSEIREVAPSLASHAEAEEMAIDLDHDPLEIADEASIEDGSEVPDLEALDSEDEKDDPGFVTDVSEVPMHIVPLYSILSSENQLKAFRPPPEGFRLVVVATNVAETSLTIPGIRYVVDCGRAKQREYDAQSGIQTFKVSWISQASAAQRAGRAGRTGPGHCYRLYSSSIFERHFEQFSQPEILRVPIEGIVLQMKSMHIDAVANFPFPTPPNRLSLKMAETSLTHLGALQYSKSDSKAWSSSLCFPRTGSKVTVGGHITELGKAMSLFPISPRYSKMLVAGRQHDILPYIITVVAALSVGSPFIHEKFIHDREQEGGDDAVSGSDLTIADDTPPEFRYIINQNLRDEELRKLERRRFFKSQETHARLGNGVSDVFRTLSVVGAYEYAGGGTQFCAEHFVRTKAMEEIHKLRVQLSSIVQSNFPEVTSGFAAKLPPPSDKQLKILRQLLTAGLIENVAVRKDLTVNNATGVKFASARGVPYQALGVDEDVFIHPSSILFHSPPPEYVIYHEIVRSSQVYIKMVTVINPAWLHTLAPSMCTFSKPKEIPVSMKNRAGTIVTPRFGDTFALPPVRL